MKNKRILLIEDDVDIRETLLELMEIEGLSVQVATNGEEGLKLLHSGIALPHIILVDLKR